MEAQLETCTSSEHSKLWKDDIKMFDYYKYILRLPEPTVFRILRFLRYPDLISLKSTCPELADACDLHIKLMEQQEFPRRPFFQFERCAPDEDVDEEGIEMMSERQNACMAYFPENQSAYLFGGETLESNAEVPGATFNDMWKLDTSTMKWSRVIISSAPYPSPKCHASLVAWGNRLILFGGRRAFRFGLDTFYSELHYFYPETSTWQYVSTYEAPELAGHSAVVCRDLMIVYGGWKFDPYDFVDYVRVLDLKTEMWRDVHMQKWKEADDSSEFPRFHSRKTKLVLIRDGLLLVTGEMLPSDYGSSALIQFNPDAPFDSTWQWKRIETIGRWWRPKMLPANENGGPRINFDCNMPNFEFHQIADVQNSKIIRLVSMGRLKNEFQSIRSSICEKYDAVQSKYREFCRQLKCHLETELQKRAAATPSSEENQKTCAIFKYQNILCQIEGCFIDDNGNSTNSSQNTHRFKVIDRVNDNYSNQDMPHFDDFDLWEMRSSIQATVNQLHSKYYKYCRMEYLVARVPMRNSALRRLSLYVTEIDRHVKFEEFKELRWTAQPLQYPSSVETRDYCLIGAHHDVIMHSGVVRFNESMRRMGQSTLLTPISKIETTSTSSGSSIFY